MHCDYLRVTLQMKMWGHCRENTALSVMMVLLWLIVMLGPTILAADAPHFLRAAGVMPAAVLLAAIGLAWIWKWPCLPSSTGALLVGGLLAGSLIWTIDDYQAYARNPQVAFAFEAAATELAEELQSEIPETDVYIDDRLWTSWPSLSFLVEREDHVKRYLSVKDLPLKVQDLSAIYAWPYDSLDFIPGLLELPVLVTIEDGPLTRGDLEEEAYPLYLRYGIEPASGVNPEPIADFAGQVYLHEANVAQLDPNTLQVDIYWEAGSTVEDDLVVFVHVTGPEGLIGQEDTPLASGRWQSTWWQPDLYLRESHSLALSQPFDSSRHQILLGIYRANNRERLPVYDVTNGEGLGTTWTVDGE